MMLGLIVLLIIASFSVAYWLVTLVAPWWTALPVALLVTLIVFIRTVKFKP